MCCGERRRRRSGIYIGIFCAIFCGMTMYEENFFRFKNLSGLRVSCGVSINNIEVNFFVFQFYNDKDKKRILEGRFWNFDD